MTTAAEAPPRRRWVRALVTLLLLAACVAGVGLLVVHVSLAGG